MTPLNIDTVHKEQNDATTVAQNLCIRNLCQIPKSDQIKALAAIARELGLEKGKKK